MGAVASRAERGRYYRPEDPTKTVDPIGLDITTSAMLNTKTGADGTLLPGNFPGTKRMCSALQLTNQIAVFYSAVFLRKC